MSRRFKLVVAYDGAAYAGWQSQPNNNGIQDHLEDAILGVTGEAVRLSGSGRTDAGVHAVGQVAHVDLTTERFTGATLLKAINANLPPSIRVMRCSVARPGFHARFSVRSKTYRYRIWRGEVLPPFEHGRAWHVYQQLDMRSLGNAARQFQGTHDFRGFAANRGRPEASTTRTVRSIRVKTTPSLLEIDIEASGFLYKMARLIVGALVDVASGRLTPAELGERLRKPSARERRTSAPAYGLFLVRVRY